MITNTKGLMVYVNPAWVKTYGYSKAEAVGESPRLIRSEYQDSQFYRAMWERILDPKLGYWRGEVINKTKDGKLVTVLLTITPYRDPKDSKGAIGGFMGIAVDLTLQKEMELKVLQQDRLASVGLVASGLAHEVGTPLGVIRGRAELLTTETRPEVIRRGLEVIMEQIDRVSRLIKSFLRASRVSDEATIQSLELEPFVADMLTLLIQPARKHGIEMKMDIPMGFYVQADSNHLHQVLLNLLINSIHAIERKLQDLPESKNQISLRASKLDDHIEIQVSDTGCGIPTEILGKIFRPFFTTKDIGKGTGLGLAICAQVMSEMGGSIAAASEGENQGATFTIRLPQGKPLS